MLLLLVFGVMNLLWIGVLTALVLLEKVLPHARWLARGTGLVLLGWGALLVGQALVATA